MTTKKMVMIFQSKKSINFVYYTFINCKFMKKSLYLVFVLISITGYAQNKKAIKNFNLGVEAFNKNDFKTADSLFTLSAKKEPHKDTYFNLAVTKQKLGDHCAFCDNLKKASYYGSGEASKLFEINCVKMDTVYYTSSLNKENIEYYCIYSIEECFNKKSFYFFKKFKNADSTLCFFVSPINTSLYKEDDFISPNFDVEKLPLKNMIFSPCNHEPSYPGGGQEMYHFMICNMKYPDLAAKNHTQGTVYMTFFVEKDGSITDVKVFQGIGDGCDEESVKLVEKMPKWNPGKKDGVITRMPVIFPITFIIPVRL